MSEINEENFFAGITPSLDTSLPIGDILKGVENSGNNSNVVEEKPALSPLEQMRQEKEKETAGMIVSNDALEAGKDEGPKKNVVYNDDRVASWEKEIESYDDTLRKRNAVMVLREPTDQGEYIELMQEIESVKFDENGKAYFDYINPMTGKPETPRLCRLRNEDEKLFDFSSLNQYENNTAESDDSDSSTDNSDTDSQLTEKQKRSVQVIIDKTGFGADFKFSDEEKEKIVSSDLIHVKEVKVIDINTIRGKRNHKSFSESLNKFDYRGLRTTVYFPASGFKAQMRGLTHGEWEDINISDETVTFDQMQKKLTVIYNCMSNVSCKPFTDFDDFLKRFAFSDIPVAEYGLLVSSELEVSEIGLKCNNPSCNKSFNWKYSPRSLFKIDRCSPSFIDKMEKLISADPSEFSKLAEDSSVSNSVTIELPVSKFVVELGVPSSYDFLNVYLPIYNEDKIKEEFGEINDAYRTYIILLPAIRCIMIPEDDGTYTECTGYKDIINALYRIDTREISLVGSYAGKALGEYESTFSFDNVECPHCHHITKHLDIDIEDLLFQIYQRLMNIEIDQKTLPNF